MLCVCVCACSPCRDYRAVSRTGLSLAGRGVVAPALDHRAVRPGVPQYVLDRSNRTLDCRCCSVCCALCGRGRAARFFEALVSVLQIQRVPAFVVVNDGVHIAMLEFAEAAQDWAFVINLSYWSVVC